MPAYEFRCRQCGDTFILQRPMSQSSDEALCPAGHGDTVRRLNVASAGTTLTGGSSIDAAPSSGGAAEGGAAADRRSLSCVKLHRVVREGGVEPPRPFGHTDLNRARLPIPPLAPNPPQWAASKGYRPAFRSTLVSQLLALVCCGPAPRRTVVGEVTSMGGFAAEV